MKRLFIGMVAIVILASIAHAQPKGGEKFFAAPGDKFDEKTLKLPRLDAPPAAPAAGVPPAIFAGDGILPPKIWSGGAEFGINGATGNSELLNIRAGVNARRKTTDNLFDFDLLYQYGLQNHVVTQNQMLLNARDEILFAGSPISAFVSTNTEYDDLKAYRFRVGVYGGLGAVLHETESFNWRGRIGAGAVRLIGLPENKWVPEGVIGTDLTYKIDERSSFIGTADYYPQLNNWSSYRVRTRIAYQIILDPKTCTTLRFGIQDRYDSNPGTGSRNNDFNYFATLGFTY